MTARRCTECRRPKTKALPVYTCSYACTVARQRRLAGDTRPVVVKPAPRPRADRGSGPRASRARYALADLEALIGWPTASQLAQVIGCSTREVVRWRTQGLPEKRADELAIRFGFHPALVWPDWLEDRRYPPGQVPTPVPAVQRPAYDPYRRTDNQCARLIGVG